MFSNALHAELDGGALLFLTDARLSTSHCAKYQLVVTVDEKRLFCESLGIAVEQVKVERVPHPTKRTHMLYKVSHPWFGEGLDQLEHEAWHKFFDQAQSKPALPMRCQGKTKKGAQCQNAPQKGEIYCGPHLDQLRRSGG
jgi:hypothetical protein